MNAFLLSCVFSVENKMPGGYWSRTGTADLSGALLHQKNGTVQCRSTLAVGETGIWGPSGSSNTNEWLRGNSARTG